MHLGVVTLKKYNASSCEKHGILQSLPSYCALLMYWLGLMALCCVLCCSRIIVLDSLSGSMMRTFSKHKPYVASKLMRDLTAQTVLYLDRVQNVEYSVLHSTGTQ